jgi:hypothetical protein
MDKTKEAALRALFGKPECVADYEASITYGQSETTYRHGGQVHVESCDEMRDRWPCSAAEECPPWCGRIHGSANWLG